MTEETPASRQKRKLMQLLENVVRTVPFEEIQERDRLDDRVAAVNSAFVNLIGVNEGFVEFCPNSEPPKIDECIAWIWLTQPQLSAAILEISDHSHFKNLVVQYMK